MYFDKKQAKANGFASIGVGLGGIVIAPVLTELFQLYGYTGAMVVLGGIICNLFVCGSLFRPLQKRTLACVDITEGKFDHFEILQREEKVSTESKESEIYSDKIPNTETTLLPSVVEKCEEQNEMIETHEEDEKKETLLRKRNKISNRAKCPSIRWWKESFNSSLLRKKQFMLFSFLMMSMLICNSVGTFLTGIATDRGISTSKVAIILTINAAVSTTSRLISSPLFDLNRVRTKRPLVLGILTLLRSVVMVLLPLACTFPTLLAAMIVESVVSAVAFAQHITVLNDLVGNERLPHAIGLCRVFMGIGSLCGPVIGGQYACITAISVTNNPNNSYDSWYLV